MDKTRFRRLLDIVGTAMDHRPDERDAYVVSVCAGDEGLLEEARALLTGAAASSLGDVTARLGALVDRAAADAVDDGPRHPSRIGPYEIVRPLGRGGMGVVYLGRQETPLRRDVAIKVVRHGLVDRDTFTRFAAERQALALMQHPGIARVFDAGTTDDDLPYFVMELAEGPPITEYCDRERLTLDERLDLFLTVCHAVHGRRDTP
jgi:serine/threonine protein kinase